MWSEYSAREPNQRLKMADLRPISVSRLPICDNEETKHTQRINNSPPAFALGRVISTICSYCRLVGEQIVVPFTTACLHHQSWHTWTVRTMEESEKSSQFWPPKNLKTELFYKGRQSLQLLSTKISGLWIHSKIGKRGEWQNWLHWSREACSNIFIVFKVLKKTWKT